MARPVWRDGSQRLEDDQNHENALPSRIEEPSPEDPLVEVTVFHANFVKAGPTEQHLACVFLVPRGEPNDRYRCKNDIVCRVELEVVDLRA